MEKLTYKKVLTFDLSDVKIKKYRAEITVKKQSQKTFEKNLKKILKKCWQKPTSVLRYFLYRATDKNIKNNTQEISKNSIAKIKKTSTTSFLFCPKNRAKKYLKIF